MFRRYTFRQVAIAGSLLVFVGILASAFCQTFTQFIISYSAMYGIGVGLCMASNSLAVNTYFKHRRRRATGFSWTITGLGPIIFPHVSTYLLTCCGIKGTILLYAVFTLSALLCALTLQPVLWHVRKPAATAEDADAPNADKVLSENEDLPEYECKFCQQQRRHKRGIFSSQYLFNADDKDTPGFEITEPGTPMLARANDNWFGSKQSLASERYRQRLNKQMGIEDQTTKTEDCNKLLLPNYFNREREANDRYASKLSNCSKLAMEDYQCTCSEEKTLMDKVNEKERKLQKQRLQAELDAELEAEEEAKNIKLAMESTDSARVYRATTISLSQHTKQKSARRHDKSDLGDNFIAPDGGWAWVVCVAAGISNFAIYPCLQMFGLLFRERLALLGLSSPEITTIINTNSAISSCTGLLNGPMFRRFSYRQVALTGSCLIFLGLLSTAFCETFPTYMINYAILYGFGMGISFSASNMAFNTYFKQNRRKAAGFSWAITGVGPIIFPHIVTALIPLYGVQGTVIIFAAFSLHTLVSALIYQPVKYHAVILQTANKTAEEPTATKCKYCELQEHVEQQQQQQQQKSVIYDEHMDEEEYNITAPGTPMLARANDGWYGSKLSLSSNKINFRKVASYKDVTEMTAAHNNNSHANKPLIQDTSSLPQLTYCTCLEMKLLQPVVEERDHVEIMPAKEQLSIIQKIVVFLDLDLLKDFTYVNLVIGLTIINFGELNFSILTPFILHDFGLENTQITIAMSTLASLDISMRFLIPFFTAKLHWDNRIFFMIGVLGIALGRTVVACTRSYTLILSCFAWIGFCKGIRTVFWPLIIPGIVPLKRLPAATGLQLVLSGLFILAGGPLVGIIRDHFNYSVCLHFLNFLSFLAAVLWGTEALVRRYKQKHAEMLQAQKLQQTS